MPKLDWDDLRYLLAVARTGRLAAAARQCRVDATTIARRLKAVESTLGVRLFERLPDGELRLTQAGEMALIHAEKAETAVFGMVEAVTGADGVAAGIVRVTAVPMLVCRVLVPAAAALLQRHPGLKLDLVADPRGADLIRREADIALRLARPAPDVGGTVLARRVGFLDYAVYAPETTAGSDNALPWLGYDDTMAALPQARWLALAGRHSCRAGLALNDAEALVQAVRAGLGRSILPRVVGDGIAGLRCIASPDDLPPLPKREIWLLTHPDQRSLTRIEVVSQWLREAVAALGS